MRSLRLMLPRPLVSLCLAPTAWLAVTASAHAQPAATQPVPDDRALSVGRWGVASVEWDGKPVDPQFLALLRITYRADGSWAVLFKSVTVAAGTSTNRQEESPKTFEMETLGSEGIKPTRFWGIYRFDGDTRVLCIAPAGKPRPEHFLAPRRSGRMLVTLRRISEP